MNKNIQLINPSTLILLFVFACELLSPSYAFAAADKLCQCTKKIKVGVSLPLTASAISSGESVKNSILLADQIYDSNNCVEFIFEDDQLLAKNTVMNVRKFFSINKVDAIIVFGTPTSLAAAPLIEEAKIPMIALSILKKLVADKKYIMKHWVSAEVLTKAVAEETKNRNYKSVAVVSTQNDAMLDLRDQFVNGNSAEVILDQEYVRDDFDFKSSIVKIMQKSPDAVYVLLFPPQTGLFVKQLRELGYQGDIFGVHNTEDPKEVVSSAGKMIGMWLANADDTIGENYHAKYKERYGLAPSIGGANGFDSAKMLIEAGCQSTDINSYLHNLKNFQGAFGKYGATKNNDFDFVAVIKNITKDGFQKSSQ